MQIDWFQIVVMAIHCRVLKARAQLRSLVLAARKFHKRLRLRLRQGWRWRTQNFFVGQTLHKLNLRRHLLADLRKFLLLPRQLVTWIEDFEDPKEGRMTMVTVLMTVLSRWIDLSNVHES